MMTYWTPRTKHITALLLVSVIFTFTGSIFTASKSAFAQNASTGLNVDNDQPIEITADQSLEWYQNEKKFIARENAHAIQGGTAIQADILIADYIEGERENDIEIRQITADRNVVISNDGNKAFGDLAIYEVDAGIATMTGQNLRLQTPEQVITAKDRFEYDLNKNQVHAIGRARIQQDQDTMSAHKITAILEQNANGETVLKSVKAYQNVVIQTPEETLRGNNGTYDAQSNIAEITGDVIVTRGQNILEGDRAQVNLTTNVSKMFGGAPNPVNGKSRVRGTFFPSSQE